MSLAESRASQPRILEPQCEWTSGDLADEDTWTVHLTSDEVGELERALRVAGRAWTDPVSPAPPCPAPSTP